MRTLRFAAFLIFPTLAAAADKPVLSPKEIADGWVMLFDGESTFGWKVDGESEVRDGKLILGGTKETTATCTLHLLQSEFDYTYAQRGGGEILFKFGTQKVTAKSDQPGASHSVKVKPTGSSWVGVSITVPSKTVCTLQRAVALPTKMEPLFNGRDLAGWKVHPGDKYKSVFSVTKEGWLNVKNGPGDLQTEKTFDDFVLQLDCFSNGKALNSGLFFRCLKDQYQNGYEMQIQNGIKDNDRTKPADFGTGAIYRRVPARKVVSNDREWFTMTLVAHGKHLRTFVNGYPTVDWTDDRKADDNPRKGAKTGKGHLSIQGHDPTTDLSFRNIKVAELARE